MLETILETATVQEIAQTIQIVLAIVRTLILQEITKNSLKDKKRRIYVSFLVISRIIFIVIPFESFIGNMRIYFCCGKI